MIYITIALVGTYVLLRDAAVTAHELALAISAAVTVVVCLIEIKRAPWRTMPAPKRPMQDIASHAFTTWLGMMACVAVLLFGWWLLSEYKRSYYKPFFDVLPSLLPFVPVVIAAAIFIAEWRMGAAPSGARELGLFLQGKRNIDGKAIRDEFLALAIKGFFLPINFSELMRALEQIRGNEMLVFGDDFLRGHAVVLIMLYALILAAIIPGYFFSSRLFGNEIKKVDHTWFGWVITLCCYSPLVVAVFNRWFNYRPAVANPEWAKPWTNFFAGHEWLLLTVAGLIILLEIWHYWGEAHFGLRSSNLTNRGVITDGPYRACKHPVYVAKCIGWALIWLPFFAGTTPLESLRLTLLFFCICGVYVLRGYVEERLLSSDPDYVSYALYIDKKGMFAWVGRLCPPLSFRYRYERWQDARAKGRLDF